MVRLLIDIEYPSTARPIRKWDLRLRACRSRTTWEPNPQRTRVSQYFIHATRILCQSNPQQGKTDVVGQETTHDGDESSFLLQRASISRRTNMCVDNDSCGIPGQQACQLSGQMLILSCACAMTYVMTTAASKAQKYLVSRQISICCWVLRYSEYHTYTAVHTKGGDGACEMVPLCSYCCLSSVVLTVQSAQWTKEATLNE